MYPFELDSFRIVFAWWQIDANTGNRASQSEPPQVEIQPARQGNLLGKIGLRVARSLGIVTSGLLLLGLGLHTCGCIDQATAQVTASIRN